MWRLSVCFLSICAASAVHPHADQGFYYTKQMSMFRRSEEECRVCFGHDCVPLAEAKCQYYMAISELQSFPDDDEEVSPNNELQSIIDTKLYDFIDATQGQDYEAMSCIPMLSTYTDCHKDNQCTGCTTCTCDAGKWSCSAEECRAERLDFSRQLTVAVASLKSMVTVDNQSRRKRSTNKTRGHEIDTKITFEELAQWINETKTHFEDIIKPLATTTESYRKKMTTLNPDYLAFDEVLSNIASDNNNISRKKSTLEPIDRDYISFIDIVSTGINSTDEHKNKYAEKVDFGTKHYLDENSFKVDLLEDLKDKLEKQFRMENNTGVDKARGDTKFFETNNYLDDVNSLSIVKRDVSKINDSNILQNDEIADNHTNTIKDFKNNVLYPLITVINEKENELNQLSSIKNSLIELIKGMDSNFTLDLGMVNNTDNNKTLFSIYRLELVPETPNMSEDYLETRRVGEGNNDLDMYLKKLQRDVFEIIRDLKAIKQSMNSKKLPKDLSLLLRGLNHYVRSQGKSYMKSYRHLNKLRRFLPEPNDVKIKRMALQILELCDKGIGNQGSLNQLSDTTKGILQRIVKQNQIEDFVTFGVRISDPENTLTKDIKSIGTKWPEISDIFLNCSPSDKLYHLKLLHLMLKVDINKLTNTMKLLNFAQNRRVNFDTTLSDQEMTRVYNDIIDLSDKMQKYFQKESEINGMVTQNKDSVNLEVPSKKSFLKQIKSLFKSSRNDVRNMLHKKVSKSEIVKELAKNKLGELARQKMAEYEETLKKWQNKLSVRTKRSTSDFRKLKDHLNNILPSYLRGKVNPAINQSKKKHTKRLKKHRNDIKENVFTRKYIKENEFKGNNDNITTKVQLETTPEPKNVTRIKILSHKV